MRRIVLFIFMLTLAAAAATTLFSEDFESGWNNWYLYVDQTAEGNAQLITEGNSTAMQTSVINVGTEAWHIHLRRDGFTLTQGKQYTISFDARAQTGWSRPINMKLEQGYAPYTNHSNLPDFTLTDVMTPYEFTFTMTNATDGWAGICFEYGHYEGTTHPIDVIVDNIVITESDPLTVPPLVAITSPAEGTLVNSSPVMVNWTVDGTLQTTDLTAALTEGPNQIIRSFTRDNLTGSDTVNIILDTQAPIVTITTPAEGSFVNTTPVTVNWSVDGVSQTTDLTADLTEGTNTITRSATDQAGNSASASVTVTLDTENPHVVISSPISGTTVSTPSIPVVWSVDGVNQTVETTESLTEGENLITREAVDEAGNAGITTVSVTYTPEVTDTTLPVDPSTIAPVLDSTEYTSLLDATSFIYTGTKAIQTGVAEGTIEEKRVAIIRGKVMDKLGNALPGAVVKIHNHPEFGETMSRADGLFDMVVNGGGTYTISYTKEGYFEAQRKINTPWKEYIHAPDVMMIQPDPVATPVAMKSTEMQVASGSVVTDEDGTRQARIFFPAGVEATNLNLETITVRATEYTVGENGEELMPAEIDPNIAYTYCVELSIDEAEDVTFNKPIFSYLENFLDFPVGMAVPSGYYDKKRAAWIPSDNGRVISVLSIDNGVASLDIDGSGTAATPEALAALGVETAELEKLAATYTAGTSLWRVPITHFTPWDYNWPYGLADDAIGPKVTSEDCDVQKNNEFSCKYAGSVIDVQNQSVGEVVDVTGTPFNLHYASDRVTGRKAGRTITIPAIGETVPPTLNRIVVSMIVAGKYYTKSLYPSPNNKTTFTWDGRDAFGRIVSGYKEARIGISYVYEAVYRTPGNFSSSFGNMGGAAISGSRTRQEISVSQEFKVNLYNAAHETTLGGWSFDQHHRYDIENSTLVRGDGIFEKRKSVGGGVISTIAGNGVAAFSGDNAPALQAGINPGGLAMGVDGTIYVCDHSNHRVRKISPDGIIATIAGTGIPGYTGDGGPAIDAQLNLSGTLSIGQDRSLYVAVHSNHSVRKISPEGIIATIAGTGNYGYSGDGELGVNAQFSDPWTSIISADGSVYISDQYNCRLRKLSTKGVITTIAGNGGSSYPGDGRLATDVGIGRIMGIALSTDGSIYVSSFSQHKIYKISPEGIITTYAGTGSAGFSGDGGVAVQAKLNGPMGLSISADGTLFVGEYLGHRVRKISPNGIIMTVAGTGVSGFSGDSEFAENAKLSSPGHVMYGLDGSLYISDIRNSRIRKITFGKNSFEKNNNEIIIPNKTGTELYYFTLTGKHLRTVDALTNTLIYRFNYTEAGLLSSVIDGYGDSTSIERNPDGTISSITSADNERTDILLNSDGYIERITNPAGEYVSATYYDAEGLMKSFTDGEGNTSRFFYDTEGRLIRDEDDAGRYVNLERRRLPRGYEVIKTVSATDTSDYTTTYQTEKLANGDTRQRTFGCCGGAVEILRKPDGTVISTAPDGTVTTTKKGPDPRFGMQAPITTSTTVTLPSGKSTSVRKSRTTELNNPADKFDIKTLTDSVIVGTKIYTTVYNAATREIVSTSPSGITSSSVLDTMGRVITSTAANFDAVSYIYDERGRLKTVSQGDAANLHETNWFYNSEGYLGSVTNAMNESTSFEYDPVGRVTKTTLPDNSVLSYNYDKKSRITGITPPDKTIHTFEYDKHVLGSYTAPNAAVTSRQTQYRYNRNRKVTGVTRPDGKEIGISYDDIGRISGVTSPRGEKTFTYSANSSNIEAISVAGGGITYSYDGSLPTSVNWLGAIAGSVEVSYNSELQVDSQSVNGVHKIGITYDSDGIPASIGDLAIVRDATNGSITSTTLGSVSDGFTYNTMGELTGYNSTFTGADLFSYAITERDKLGRILEKSETVDGITSVYNYKYDQLGQLIEVRKDGLIQNSYDYDGNGNRTGGVYDGQDRMLSYGGSDYTYNDNGELLTKTSGSDITSYDYDVFGNLLAVTLPNASNIEYLVDARNRRIGKKVNGSLVQGFLYQDQLNPVAELDGLGNVVSRFVYGVKGNVPEYMIKGGVTYRIISDHLGSVRLVIDIATGSVVQKMSYDEFGIVLEDSNPGFQPFGFAGGIYEAETGLVRFGARDYDPVSGRWCSKDPIGFNGGDSNLFRYCGNDGVNFVDPNGLMKLPSDPSGLGPDWVHDPKHRDPNGIRFRDKNGRILDFHKGRPDPKKKGKTWKEKDHWHVDKEDEHLNPGDEIPDVEEGEAEGENCKVNYDNPIPNQLPNVDPSLAPILIGTGLILGDILLGGPTGEGIGPGIIILQQAR